MKIRFAITFILVIFLSNAFSQSFNKKCSHQKQIVVGAERTDVYFPYVGDKNFALVANHTSLIKGKHLVDSLLSLPVNLKKIFCPEHGFRGTANAGQHLSNYIDEATGIPVVSLYGKNKKPNPKDLENIDIMVFDLQDVGARFYTYISTLTLVMEACAENGIPLIILDRPNPNGFYVDGPVLEYGFESFVGMHRIPVVHGMTVAEYARMINGEAWLTNAVQCDLIWVKCLNYDHNSRYQLPVKPSPNLPDMNSVYLYPSLCFFEGTVVSIGRGTDHPFTMYGHPDLSGDHVFTPESNSGASNPKLKGARCNGEDLSSHANLYFSSNPGLSLSWLMKAYRQLGAQPDFFNAFFDKLAGGDALRKQIQQGLSEDEIRASWEQELMKFKKIRKNYLLYDDFE
ncbi:MAG: DUF1343 domain-containing protein [Bacteroidales bacterium]|nr:DUF1343 domain-containing protein [Bacteroidales bacterium]